MKKNCIAFFLASPNTFIFFKTNKLAQQDNAKLFVPGTIDETQSKESSEKKTYFQVGMHVIKAQSHAIGHGFF
jgi:hypothetical protein